ncbi:MAG TPA: patatin-like phospholipase family protein [Gemmatimonadaceae bacterium]
MPHRQSRGGVGLALAGGGPGGAIYEIGALFALDEALEGLDLARLSCYVGVSAGALLAACLANGMSPELLARVLDQPVEGEEPFDPGIFFSPNYREFARRGIALPALFAQMIWSLTRRNDRTVLASVGRLTHALPTGLFDNEPIRQYLEHVLARPGRTDDFRKLGPELVIVATDLASGRPIRFGSPGRSQVPISRAVQASTAMPGLYPPVEIDGRNCVDGVLLKTVHASVALDYGVELLLCVNPIVPVDTTTGEADGTLSPGALYKGGLPLVLSQTFRTLVHSRLEIGLAGYVDRYPDATVLLFEPPADEYEMFFSNILTLSDRHRVCELAYAITREDLRCRADELEPVLARHGVRLRRDLLEDRRRTLWGTLAERGATPSELARKARVGARRRSRKRARKQG